MTVTEIWAHPKGNRRERQNLSELRDGDLLHLFRSFAAEVTPAQLLNESNESCAAVEDIQPLGRTLTLAVEVGRYGGKGRLIDTTTMQSKGEFGPDDAVQVITHGVLGLALADPPSPGDPCSVWHATTQENSGRTMWCNHRMTGTHALVWQYGGPSDQNG